MCGLPGSLCRSPAFCIWVFPQMEDGQRQKNVLYLYSQQNAICGGFKYEDNYFYRNNYSRCCYRLCYGSRYEWGYGRRNSICNDCRFRVYYSSDWKQEKTVVFIVLNIDITKDSGRFACCLFSWREKVLPRPRSTSGPTSRRRDWAPSRRWRSGLPTDTLKSWRPCSPTFATRPQPPSSGLERKNTPWTDWKQFVQGFFFAYSSNSFETGTSSASAILNSVSIDTPKARVGLSTLATNDQDLPILSANASCVSPCNFR